MRVHSLVAIIPLFAVKSLEPEIVECRPGFKRRMQWLCSAATQRPRASPGGCASGCPHHVHRAARWPGCARRLTAFARVMVCPRGEARRQGLVVALTP
jgi:hypothetical protein